MSNRIVVLFIIVIYQHEFSIITDLTPISPSISNFLFSPGDIIAKCRKFRDNCTRTTRQLIDKKKREIRDTVNEKEAALRVLEIQLPSLRQQNDEADLIINSKNQADRCVWLVVCGVQCLCCGD